MALLWPGGGDWPVRIVPIAMNHVQHPLPSPRRAYRLGQAVGRALAAWPGDARVVVLGTGGLSHQLDGARAGFINKPFDLMCMEALVDEPEQLTRYSALDLVREAGAQGTELMAWIAARAALPGRVTRVHSNYHVPISNTATGLLVLENPGAHPCAPNLQQVPRPAAKPTCPNAGAPRENRQDTLAQPLWPLQRGSPGWPPSRSR